MELGVMGNAIGDSATAKPNTAETIHLGLREQGVGAEDASNEFSEPVVDRRSRSLPVVTPRLSSNKYDPPSTQAKILLVSKGKDTRPKLSLLPNIFDGVVDGTLRVAGISTKTSGKISMVNSASRNNKNENTNTTITVIPNQTSNPQEQNAVTKNNSTQNGQNELTNNNNSSTNVGTTALVSHGTPGGCSQGSTSTPGLDDGYGSSNSSPHSSGRHKPSKHGSANTLLFHKKEMLVQVEEDSCVVQSLIIEGSQSSGESRGSAPGSPSSLTEGDVKSTVLDTITAKEHGDDGRETWGTGADFLLSIIGFAVDLANVWRFPYLCYKNGGGAFLIPYTLMLVFGALPLFYMELILGQFNRQGPISLWKICPLFKGVGFCAVMVAFYVSFYYNVIIGWSLYFLVSSATTELPWIHCNNTWNSEGCWDSSMAKYLNQTGNGTEYSVQGNETQGPLNKFSPASEFFHRSVLEMQRSAGLHDLGLPKWQLVLCLLTVYTMLYLSLFKGVKSSGKVVWATATLPYVVLSLLLARGLLLPGAAKGIAYYLSPQLSRLSDVQVWVDAAVQIFYSVGAGFGVHLSYASYNTFHNNCYRDCLITTAVNCFTSFFSGFVIFTYLGFMSHKQGVPISSVATEGPGLVFQVYPEAIATLPGAHIWSMLFFFMLIMLGLDSGMGGLECVITGLMDEFKWLFGSVKYAREKFTLCAVGFSFCVACLNVTPGGIYMFHLLDTYSAGISLLCSALFEAVAVSWFYGLEKFTADVESMLGFRPGLYWRICWKFISPSFIIGVVIFALLFHQPLSYQQYSYPWWAEVLGWSLALSSVLMIPAVAIYKLRVTEGTFKERFALCISPPEDQETIKNTKVVTRYTWRHWLYV